MVNAMYVNNNAIEYVKDSSDNTAMVAKAIFIMAITARVIFVDYCIL